MRTYILWVILALRVLPMSPIGRLCSGLQFWSFCDSLVFACQQAHFQLGRVRSIFNFSDCGKIVFNYEPLFELSPDNKKTRDIQDCGRILSDYRPPHSQKLCSRMQFHFMVGDLWLSSVTHLQHGYTSTIFYSSLCCLCFHDIPGLHFNRIMPSRTLQIFLLIIFGLDKLFLGQLDC